VHICTTTAIFLAVLWDRQQYGEISAALATHSVSQTSTGTRHTANNNIFMLSRHDIELNLLVTFGIESTITCECFQQQLNSIRLGFLEYLGPEHPPGCRRRYIVIYAIITDVDTGTPLLTQTGEDKWEFCVYWDVLDTRQRNVRFFSRHHCHYYYAELTLLLVLRVRSRSIFFFW
jgi:hypothetical protein